MAEIDSRVRRLTDILMDRGFGWLAAEIIEAIERGRDNFEERDLHVSAQRAILDQKLMSGQASAESTPEDLKYSASRPAVAGGRLVGDEQVLVAVDLFVDRLSSAAEMTSQGADELAVLMKTSVTLFVETEGEVRSVLPSKMRGSAIALRGIRNELAKWLISTVSPEEG